LKTLKTLASESVDLIVIFPPYYGLRDYDTEIFREGPVPGCKHKLAKCADEVHRRKTVGDDLFCAECGALVVLDEQLGMEPNPEEHIRKRAEVCHEAYRVLTPRGTMYLISADSYRDKELLRLPGRTADALCNDGWQLRNHLIWEKTNPKPENVQDRATRVHEDILMFVKNVDDYYYNWEAVRIPSRTTTGGPIGGKNSVRRKAQHSVSTYDQNTGWKNLPSVFHIAPEPYKGHKAAAPRKLIEFLIRASCPPGGMVLDMFAGSGTTGVVAKGLGCYYTLIELSPEFVKVIHKRVGNQQHRVPRKIIPG
jgi:DNA modification methylase